MDACAGPTENRRKGTQRNSSFDSFANFCLESAFAPLREVL